MENLNSRQILSGKNKVIAFVLFFFIIGLVWQLLRQRNINSEGVYIIAWITKTETFKGGYISSLKYYYNDQEYFVRVRSERGAEKVGEAYFIKVLPDHPKNIVLLEDHQVPNCLLTDTGPKTGWTKLPVCQ